MFSNNCHGTFSSAGSALGGGQVARCKRPSEPETQKRHSVRYRGPQCVRVLGSQVCGVDTVGQFGHGNVDLERSFPLVNAFCRCLACSIGIECQHDAAAEPFEHTNMVFGQRCSTRGNRPFDTHIGETDHVGVTLAHDGFVHAYDFVLGQMEPVEQAALVIDR